MGSQERENVATAINYFWKGLAQPYAVNDAAAKVMYEALREAQSCGASMDLVPKPTYTPGLGYIVKEIANMGRRISSGDTSIYQVCRAQIAANYRLQMQAALSGI
jgi:hypothetical protein